MIKKWMKSSTIVLTAAVMLLAGCSSSTGTKDTNAGTNAGTKAESNEGSKAEPVTIKVHTWYNLENEKFDVVKQEFEKKHPDIKIEFVSAGDNNATEHLKKVDLAAASGEEMDVIMFSSQTSVVQRVPAGMLEPIDDYLNKECIKFDDEYAVSTQDNGKYYGLPGKSVNFFVAINEDHLKAAGLPIPTDWTWDEYLDYAKKMTKQDGEKKRYGTYFHTWTNPFVMLALANQAENNYLVTDDGKSANITSPALRKSLEIRLQAEKDKSATPYTEVISQKLNYRPQYFNQDASMIATGTFLIAETGGTDKVPATFKSVFAPIPKLNKEDPTRANISSDVLSISSKSKHKEQAFTFIRWFTTEGLMVQGRNIPSWKKANMEEVLDKIIAATPSPEMIDKASLLNFLKNTVMVQAKTPPAYSAEVEKMMQEEFDKMMLQGQDIDKTINTAQEKIQKLVDANQ
ncbi:extracellular solute-binding protein [Paenibacillus alkaliterrae]|uniref:ABC transporter substrate-binding protein n=1 Tax=Paenibacillus alkaliterrae TaxID=320909 RepID=UPI001F258D48|nr:extracellular solute-binding protein [Paenibacillus alkaliterrae]MCF2938043.1 extracellular solute-binding protein [Paenibacillus alkaliterrae]